MKQISNSLNQKGQAITEYILLLVIISGLFLAAIKGIKKLDLESKFKKQISKDFAHAYQYGHPLATGWEDPEGPQMHPRYPGPNGVNFRIILNPGPKAAP